MCVCVCMVYVKTKGGEEQGGSVGIGALCKRACVLLCDSIRWFQPILQAPPVLRLARPVAWVSLPSPTYCCSYFRC